MSKKQDQLSTQLLNTYLAALSKAQEPSAYEKAIGDQALGTIDWASKGDYTSAPKGVFFNLADPAERKRQRELITGAGARGTAALGTPNPTALALDEENRANQFDEDQAGNYQQEVSGAIGRASGVAGNLAGMDLSRKTAVLGSTAGLAGQGVGYSLRPKVPWWKSALNSFAAGAGQAAQTAEMGGG